jgi:hypothetical protein
VSLSNDEVTFVHPAEQHLAEVDRPDPVARFFQADVVLTAGQMHTFTANIWWVSETGPTLNIHSLFHISTNADGEITSAKVDLEPANYTD